jgi:hypothetical protein
VLVAQKAPRSPNGFCTRERRQFLMRQQTARQAQRNLPYRTLAEITLRTQLDEPAEVATAASLGSDKIENSHTLISVSSSAIRCVVLGMGIESYCSIKAV